MHNIGSDIEKFWENSELSGRDILPQLRQIVHLFTLRHFDNTGDSVTWLSSSQKYCEK